MPEQRLAFIGVTTQSSAIMRVFPLWRDHLGLGNVRLVGHDLPVHAAPGRYRELVGAIRADPHYLGALITTHKIDLFNACRDLFDDVDELADLCHECSCLSKADGALAASAKDPIAAGRSLNAIIAGAGGARRPETVLCLGAGGAGIAITVHLLTSGPAGWPARVIVTDRDQQRLEAMRAIHSELTGGEPPALEYVWTDDHTNNAVLSALAPGSLVINATGMGKDRPGSPIADTVLFPKHSIVWELNYRGDLRFLRQAHDQAGTRALDVHDGWQYFIHGWASVIEQVFSLTLTPDDILALSEIARTCR
jgi:shikimate 5-dehydrogenase